MAASGITVEGLKKTYVIRKRLGWFQSTKEEKVAVEDLNLLLPPGQVTGLLGLNGAGKTTTIKILSTLLLPTAGRVRVDGLDLVRDAAAVRQRINMIAGGERMIYLRLTGRENLWYFAQLYNVERRGLPEHINRLLKLVELEDAANIPAERYSKGMRQRLQIARGLVNNPAYLFLDEPTLGLDAPIARELRQVIRRLVDEGKGILLTSHYLAEVEELCSQIYVIDRGRLVAAGSSDELKTLTKVDRVVKVLLPELVETVQVDLEDFANRTGANLDMQHTEEGVVVTVRHAEEIAGAVAAIVLHNSSILKLEVIEPTLEDALIALTSHKIQTYSSI
ncbi:MAG TPA: ABC transporter ATP-binding protein [Ktedonosporobacter sp.]|nr:ABC transporter ATP-binding protein [Ktedonosporobacter sp.]